MPASGSMPLLVLGSASPRRRHLLHAVVATFDVDAADLDETPHAGELADDLARRLAREKAASIAARRPDAVVLAADSVVESRGEPLGKPATPDEARAMLRGLRGRPHRVVTGLAVARGNDVLWDGVTDTAVTMRDYSDDEVERYVATGRPFDKAGAYAIQDPEFAPVARIAGCYPNVVGLPLCAARRALIAAGVLTCDLPGGEDEANIGTSTCALCTIARSIEPPA